MDFRKKLRRLNKSIIFLFIFPFIFFHDQITNISSTLNRNNDLLVSKDAFSFFKYHIVNNSIIPLWQNYILSGSSFVSDPQSPLFYPPNYLYLILPPDIFFITSFITSFIIGSIGFYLVAKRLGFSDLVSVVCAIIYAYSPKFTGHFEAGHLSLLLSYMWFPYLIYSLISIKDRVNFMGSIILGISLWLVLINYVTIFPYVVFCLLIIVLYFVISGDYKFRQLRDLLLGFILFIFLSLPYLVSTLPYLPYTTRNLIVDEDIGPRILSYKHFFWGVFYPYGFRFNDTGTETVFYFGITVVTIGLFGFLIVKNRYKLSLIILGALSIILALGFKTGIYQYILKAIPLLYLFRITTRFWFIPIFIVSLLCGYFINKKVKNNRLMFIILLLVSSDLFIFKSQYFKLKSSSVADFTAGSTDVENIVLGDPGYYRIMCPIGCIRNPIESYKGLTMGYNPVQLKNYYEYLQKASGYQFASYAPALPPYQTYVDQPQPNSINAGILGVRYVLSPYILIDEGFTLLSKIGDLYVYKNTNEQPRVYGVNQDGSKEAIEILTDKPGFVEAFVPKNYSSIVLSEIYTPFWKAVDMYGENIPIHENENIVIEIKDLKTPLLRFIFKPPFLGQAVMIWIITVFFIFYQSVKIIKKK